MNPDLTGSPDTASPSSADHQVDWLVMEAEAARQTLANMPADTPVLLVTLDQLAQSEAGLDPDWGAGLAQQLLAQVQPPVVSEVLRGPGGLELRPSARLVFCGGQELHLTSTEFALLQELLTQNGAVLSVDGLSRAIWGHDTLGQPNYVEAHISRLRRKLREADAGRVIETVRGVGYRVRQGPLVVDPGPPLVAGPAAHAVDHTPMVLVPVENPWRDAA